MNMQNKWDEGDRVKLSEEGAAHFVRNRDRCLVSSAMRGDQDGPLLQARQSVRRARGELQCDT